MKDLALGRGIGFGLLLAAAAAAGCASAPEAETPGATSRTLSQQEVDGLLLGRGMGMAAVAEINGYPGPQHVLELKEELDLTPDQRFATSRLVGLVQGRARALGQRILDAERRLDADMAERALGSDQVRARLETIAALRAQLRFTHIHAHLEQREILTPDQLRRYYELRGREVRMPAPAMPPAPATPLTLPSPSPTPPEAAPVETPAPAPGPSATPAAPVETAPAFEDKPLEVVVPATSAPAALPETEAVTPGMQDALPDAETIDAEPVETRPQKETEPVPAREPPAYPLTPVEETPSPPPALLLEDSTPVDEETTEDEAPKMTPGMLDALPDAEPVEAPSLPKAGETRPEPPAYPVTPIEESPKRALLPEPEATVEEEAPPKTPGMQDAMEFAEPVGASAPAEEAIYIAPLEDDELQELEPVDLQEPATVDLEN